MEGGSGSGPVTERQTAHIDVLGSGGSEMTPMATKTEIELTKTGFKVSEGAACLGLIGMWLRDARGR